MEDCVRRALRNSEEVASAELDVTAARAQVQEARSAAFPRVEASLGYTRQSGFGAALGVDFSAFPGFDAGPSNFYSANLTVTQILYQADVRYGLKAARVAVDQARTSTGLTHTGVAYGVRAAYAAVLVQEAFAGAATESVELARKHLADVQAKRRAGTVTDFEVLQARVQLRNVEAVAINVRSGVKLAKARLLRVLGLDQGLMIDLTDRHTDKVDGGAAGEPGETPRLGRLLATAVGTDGGRAGASAAAARVELRVMDHMIEMQRLVLGASTAGLKPAVFLQAGYVGGGEDNYFHEDFQLDSQASLMVTWTLWDSFQTRGRYARAAAQLEQLRLKRRSLVRDIEYEIRTGMSRVESARESVESQGETVGQAAEAVRQAQVRYENGFVTELVVERARLGLAQARTNLAQAEFELFMATLDLQMAAGILEVPPPAEVAAPRGESP